MEPGTVCLTMAERDSTVNSLTGRKNQTDGLIKHRSRLMVEKG